MAQRDWLETSGGPSRWNLLGSLYEGSAVNFNLPGRWRTFLLKNSTAVQGHKWVRVRVIGLELEEWDHRIDPCPDNETWKVRAFVTFAGAPLEPKIFLEGHYCSHCREGSFNFKDPQALEGVLQIREVF